MTGTNVSCERDGPSCAAWLLGESNQPPDHVCPGVMAWSVRHFLEQRAAGEWQATFDGFWPLPAGARAIQEWPAHAESAAQNWAILQAMHRELTAFSVRDAPPIAIPRWYFPVVTDNADAQIGIAAQRHIDGVGSVWLLGLVERDDPLWWRWAGPVILTEADALLAADLDALNNAAKSLTKWYKKELLGKRAPGRRTGTTNMTLSQFLTVYENTYRCLWRDRGERPNVTDVYIQAEIPKSTFYDWVARLREAGKELPYPDEPAPPDWKC